MRLRSIPDRLRTNRFTYFALAVAAFVVIGTAAVASAPWTRSAAGKNVAEPVAVRSTTSVTTTASQKADQVKSDAKECIAVRADKSSAARASGKFCCDYCQANYDRCINNGGDPDSCANLLCACMTGCGVCGLCRK